MDEPRHGVGVEDHHPHRRRGCNITGTPNLEAAKTLMDWSISRFESTRRAPADEWPVFLVSWAQRAENHFKS
jgi:hypothetical protein